MSENPSEDETQEDESFAAMLDSSFEQREELRAGQIIEAVIVRISAEYVFLDVGRKSEGFVARPEFHDAKGGLTVKEGDKIRVFYVPGKGGDLRFTTQIVGGAVGLAQLKCLQDGGRQVAGLVLREQKGGYAIKLGEGVSAFCPYSHMGLSREQSKADEVGKVLLFDLIECSADNIVLSRKAILAKSRERRLAGLKGTLKEGMRVRGTVAAIRDFGAFVDIGGVDGLVPISEITWTRIETVGERLAKGQAVDVLIKRLDWDNNKISLSIKDALPDPWSQAAADYPPGSYRSGTVTRLEAFGAFVALAEGVEGLLHISKLGGERRLNHARQVLDRGQAVEVRIDKVDLKQRRISLSLGEVGRAQEEEEEALREYRAKAKDSSAGLGTLGALLKDARPQEEH